MKEQFPHNVTAERSLLGASLIDGSLPSMVDIEPDDFYIVKHKWIWRAMQKLSLNGGVDALTLAQELEHIGKLGEAGGPVYLTDLISEAVSTLYAEDHAGIIREMSTRRRLLLLAQDIAKAAQDQKANVNDLSKFMDRLVETTRIVGGAIKWDLYLDELWDQITERCENPEDVWGIPTGFADFDKVTGGLQQSESLLLSGNPGVGKSMWTVQVCEQMAHSAPGAMYSLEMTGTSILRRTLSAKTQIASRKLKSGHLDADDWTAITEAVERLSKLPVYLSDDANWTTTALRADLSRLKIQHGIKWFMVDYLTLMSDQPGLKEHERIGSISRNLKLICRHLDLAGVFVHSMTKEGMKEIVPKLTALRGEAGVAFDADVVCFLTDFQPVTDEDNNVSKQDRENMRTLFFGKGRELENPRKFIHYVKSPHYPQFAEHFRTEVQVENVYRG